MKHQKNTLPVAPFNLRELGPTSQANLTKRVGFFRYAHGVGADKRATLDPAPCPHCKGKVEWALTYRREGGEVVPYIYARCRTAPKTHRWDFTHWKPAPGTPKTEEQTRTLLKSSIKMARAAQTKRPTPPEPRPSVGTELMSSWIEKRITLLSAELDRLTKIRALAGEVSQLEHGGPIASPRPSYPGMPPHPTPGNGDLGRN